MISGRTFRLLPLLKQQQGLHCNENQAGRHCINDIAGLHYTTDIAGLHKLH